MYVCGCVCMYSCVDVLCVGEPDYVCICVYCKHMLMRHIVRLCRFKCVCEHVYLCMCIN